MRPSPFFRALLFASVGAVVPGCPLSAQQLDVIRGRERPVDNSAVPADQQGDIASMAASLPGVTLVPGQDGDPSGFSVLGLSPDQNNTTLNGLNFGGSNLPRDANVATSLVTTPYDVSRGGVSGAQFQIRGRARSNFLTAPLGLQLDRPP